MTSSRPSAVQIAAGNAHAPKRDSLPTVVCSQKAAFCDVPHLFVAALDVVVPVIGQTQGWPAAAHLRPPELTRGRNPA